MANYKVKRNDETLDSIVYNFYNGEFGYLEQVLATNVFLAEENTFLTKGITIYLPDLPSTKTKARISLWS